jgi:hypothetical protein
MSEYATNGAMLECTCGMMPTPLQTTANTSVFIQGQNMATISDKAPMVNIKPFGQCKMKPTIAGFGPCVPAPTAWTGFVASVQIPGGNPLLKSSSIMCGGGGMIKFKDSGQKKSNKVVTNPSSPQIDALRAAAIAGIPFCEECEKKKQPEKQIRAVDMYWMEDGSDERHYDDFPEREVTLYIETIDYTPGETLKLDLKPDDNKKFKGGKDKMTVSGRVGEDGVAVIKNFKAEYEEN